jgi:hypothetical protein
MDTLQHGHLSLWKICVNNFQNLMQQPKATCIRSAKIAPNPIPMANAVINQDTGASLEYHHLIQNETTFTVWNKSSSTEFGRLAQGVGVRIEGSNTIFFIPRHAVPTFVTYGRFVVVIRPKKKKLTKSTSDPISRRCVNTLSRPHHIKMPLE